MSAEASEPEGTPPRLPLEIVCEIIRFVSTVGTFLRLRSLNQRLPNYIDNEDRDCCSRIQFVARNMSLLTYPLPYVSRLTIRGHAYAERMERIKKRRRKRISSWGSDDSEEEEEESSTSDDDDDASRFFNGLDSASPSHGELIDNIPLIPSLSKLFPNLKRLSLVSPQLLQSDYLIEGLSAIQLEELTVENLVPYLNPSWENNWTSVFQPSHPASATTAPFLSLRTLRMTNSFGLTPLIPVLSNCPMLEKLEIENATHLGSFDFFGNNLRKIKLTRCLFDAAMEGTFSQKAFPKLEVLCLRRSGEVCERSFQGLSTTCRKLVLVRCEDLENEELLKEIIRKSTGRSVEQMEVYEFEVGMMDTTSPSSSGSSGWTCGMMCEPDTSEDEEEEPSTSDDDFM